MATYSSKVALLGSTIDYAGTFPPAALSFEQMLVEACKFRRKAKHPWLLAKVVVPIADLRKITTKSWFDAGADGTPIPLTVIASAAETPEEWLRTLSFELRELRRFNSRFSDGPLRQWAASYEIKLPESADPNVLTNLLIAALDSSLQGESLGVGVYFEVGLDAHWQERLSRTARTLAEWSEENPDCIGSVGLKVRTGGKLVPTAEQLAEVIAICTTHQLRFKATQGLHHAVSSEADFGFVNLFGAFAFAQALGIDAFGVSEIAACLRESDASAFRFEATSFHWKGHGLGLEQIESARRQHCGTFGSCSLSEPDGFLSTEVGESK